MAEQRNNRSNGNINMEGNVKMHCCIQIKGLRYSSMSSDDCDKSSRDIGVEELNFGFDLDCEIKNLKCQLDEIRERFSDEFKNACKGEHHCNCDGPNGPTPYKK